jgi:hypothetical protein
MANELEVTKATDIKVLNLLEDDVEIKKKGKEYIMIAGRNQVINRDYGSFKLNEKESKSYHDWDKSCAVAIKECEEFMKASVDTEGLTYSGKNKIPYGIKYDSNGGMTITPMPENKTK